MVKFFFLYFALNQNKKIPAYNKAKIVFGMDKIPLSQKTVWNSNSFLWIAIEEQFGSYNNDKKPRPQTTTAHLENGPLPYPYLVEPKTP